MEIITFSPQYLELMKALEDAKEKLNPRRMAGGIADAYEGGR